MRRALSSTAPAHRKAQRGFTVVEVIAVIAVMAILASIAVPALGSFIRNSQVRSASFELRAVLVRARSEAITRNTEVQLIPTGADWRNGWTLRTAAGVVIEQRAGLGDIVATPSPAQTVIYGVDGRARSGSQVIVLSGTIDAFNIHPRCITLSPSGRASTRLDQDFDPSNGCG
jgi:prepilin-type N-terminal cleavage/methylation domain-containing protein